MQARLSQSRNRLDARGSWKTGARWLLALALGVAVLSHGVLVVAQEKEKSEKPAENTLYKRLGGYDALAAVTDDFLKTLGQDKQFERFGTGRSLGSKQRARQLVVDQLCALTGGPCIYFGREMKDVHQGLGITENEWNTSVKYLEAVLDKHAVPQKEHQEFIAIVAKLKPDIVEPTKK